MASKDAWNDAYARSSLTNWERNSLYDLAGFLRRCDLAGDAVRTILDAGCGRGMRGLLALIETPGFNVPGVTYTGIDFSSAAIAEATGTAARWRHQIHPIGDLEEAAVAGLSMSRRRYGLRADISFVCDDLFAYLPGHDQPYDLVVDWMCMHELAPHDRQIYARHLATHSRKHLVINAFCTELSTQQDLEEAVPGVKKYQLARTDIENLFPDFHISMVMDYPEDLQPSIGISDGIVAAKRAYHLLKR